MRKTLAQQSCLQLKGPVRRYRPDAEAADAPCGSPSFRSVNGIPCASDPWVQTGSAQIQNFANAFPSRREGRIFLRPRYVHSHGAKPPINTRTCRTGSGPRLRRTYTIPTLNHISPWVSPCRPPWLRCYLSRALVRIAGARMRAVLTLGRVDVRDQLMSRPVRFRAANVSGGFFLIGNVRDLSGDRNWSAKIRTRAEFADQGGNFPDRRFEFPARPQKIPCSDA